MSSTFSHVLGMVAALGLSGGQAEAFGGATIDQPQLVLAGHQTTDSGCEFYFYHAGPGAGFYAETADVSIFSDGTNPTVYPAGSFWDRGSIASGPAITAARIESHCDLTNVTITSAIGADPGETYDSQDFIGIEFRGTFGGDGNTYDYRIALSGATNTVVINTRTLVPPPDTTPPTALSLVRQTPNDTITNADTLTWRLTFDEDVQHVDASDFAFSGTTASLGVSGSGAVYDLTLSGGDLANLTGAVAIGFSGVQDIADLADNSFAGGAPTTNQSSYILDNASDSVALSGPSGNVSGQFQVTMTFTKNGDSDGPNPLNPGADAILSALQVTNATRTGSTTFSGSTLTFHLTPTGAGAITVFLPAAAATDGAGNPTLASNTLNLTAADTEDPVVVVPPNISVNNDPGEATAVVNYATVTAVDNVAVTSGPTLIAGLASGSAFGLGETTVSYEAFDDAGNKGTASFTVTVTDGEDPVVIVPSDIVVNTDPGEATAIVDFADPTASDNVGIISAPTQVAGLISGSAFPIGPTTVRFEARDAAGNIGTASFTVTVSDGQEPVVTVPADIVVGTDPGEATAVVTYGTPTATDNVDGTLVPTLEAGLASGVTFPLGETLVTYKAEDNDGNVGTASFTVTVEDREAPVIRPIAPLALEADPSGTRQIGINTIVDDNVDRTGITPVFSLNGTVIGNTYAFPVGVNTIAINAVDTAGNAAEEEIFIFTVTPGTAPDLPVISTATINANRSMTIGGMAEVDSTVRVTFPDATFAEVTATGGTFNVTSAANMVGGTVSVAATDDRGYTSAASTVDLFPDYDGPTVTISGGPGKIEDLTPFNVTITFSESVTGFEQSDVTLTGGTISDFTDANPVFTVEITPTVAQDVTISVAADVAVDEFTNPNTASNVLTISNGTMTETEEMVVEAAQARNEALIRNRPRISRFLLGGFSGRFNAGVTQGTGNFDFGTSSDRPVWIAARGQWSKLDTIETSYANVAVGGHYAPSENLLLGVMGVFDNSVSDDGDARLESTGWLIGPYAVARTPNQPLVFSASYLVGRSDNMSSPLGTYEDDYESERVLATLGVAGEVELTRLTLIPLLDLAYAEEENEAYVGGDSVAVRSIKVTTTEATLGLDFVMPLAVDSGTFDLIGGIGATASVEDDGFNEDETTRGQTELGFRYGMANGGRLTARASYDGLGDEDYEAFGAEVIFEIEF